ncbi:hypothetical protein Gotri_023395 [Gossypium trilobum]|uniref:Uncharacterized protein n=3 Tax=Gossypium TaxID=3633 RepID=A0A7J9DIX6_9ROSI|nr:hypothetical protein [Gossypium davidsonii]MBA0643092.1 hypothetical protein [Gossypium klotzschianum]MBA0760667.1 hypothetical protein [Gossypium trilobum]
MPQLPDWQRCCRCSIASMLFGCSSYCLQSRDQRQPTGYMRVPC